MTGGTAPRDVPADSSLRQAATKKKKKKRASSSSAPPSNFAEPEPQVQATSAARTTGNAKPRDEAPDGQLSSAGLARSSGTATEVSTSQNSTDNENVLLIEIKDLKEKRMLALKSYQQEKSLRVGAAKEAEHKVADLIATIADLKMRLTKADELRIRDNAKPESLSDIDDRIHQSDELVAARNKEIARLKQALDESEGARLAEASKAKEELQNAVAEHEALASETCSRRKQLEGAHDAAAITVVKSAGTDLHEPTKIRNMEAELAALRNAHKQDLALRDSKNEELARDVTDACAARDTARADLSVASKALDTAHVEQTAQCAKFESLLRKAHTTSSTERMHVDDTLNALGAAKSDYQKALTKSQDWAEEVETLREEISEMRSRIFELNANLAHERECLAVSREESAIAKNMCNELTTKIQRDDDSRMAIQNELNDSEARAAEMLKDAEESKRTLRVVQQELFAFEVALSATKQAEPRSINDTESQTNRREVPALRLSEQDDASFAPEDRLASRPEHDHLAFVMSELETLGLTSSAYNVSLSWWYQGFEYNGGLEAELQPSEELTNVAVMRPPVQRDSSPNAGSSRGETHLHVAVEAALAEKLGLVEQLTAQLEESSATCKSLVDTVEEQEDKIRQMSLSSSMAYGRQEHHATEVFQQ